MKETENISLKENKPKLQEDSQVLEKMDLQELKKVSKKSQKEFIETSQEVDNSIDNLPDNFVKQEVKWEYRKIAWNIIRETYNLENLSNAQNVNLVDIKKAEDIKWAINNNLEQINSSNFLKMISFLFEPIFKILGIESNFLKNQNFVNNNEITVDPNLKDSPIDENGVILTEKKWDISYFNYWWVSYKLSQDNLWDGIIYCTPKTNLLTWKKIKVNSQIALYIRWYTNSSALFLSFNSDSFKSSRDEALDLLNSFWYSSLVKSFWEKVSDSWWLSWENDVNVLRRLLCIKFLWKFIHYKNLWDEYHIRRCVKAFNEHVWHLSSYLPKISDYWNKKQVENYYLKLKELILEEIRLSL